MPRILVRPIAAFCALVLAPVAAAQSAAQQAYLKASNSEAGDRFGFSMAISGDTLVVGAPFEDSGATGVNGDESDNAAGDSGAAYVFVRNGTAWTQQAYLKASNTEGNAVSNKADHFGWSVAISGDTVVVGSLFEDSGATGVNGDQSDNSVMNSGAAYVFTRDGATWTQQAYLKASNPGLGDKFGEKVSVSGNTVVIGASGEDSGASGINGDQNDESALRAGAAYVFVRSGTDWSQQAYLKASNPDAYDWFGFSVAISGETIVVGARGECSNATGVNGDPSDDSAFEPGAAYLFVRSGTSWSQQAYLKASNAEGTIPAGDEFGYSVGISGDTVVVGAPKEGSSATGVGGDPSDNGARPSGAAYVFVRNGTSWSQQAYLKASNTAMGDGFGGSVVVSGDTVIVGAATEDGDATGVNGDQESDGAQFAGAAYVFSRSGTAWSQQAYLKASNTGGNDRFGNPVAVTTTTVAVGSCVEDGSATGVNGDGSDDDATNSGAAYVFVLP